MHQTSPYSKPPLTEALLDIQVELPQGFDVVGLKTCHAEIREFYPTSKELRQAYGRLEVKEAAVTSASSHLIGFSFASLDGLQLFQARRDGFTHNRLAPYLGWELFSTEARRLWTVYRAVAEPVSIKRVAVRYINRFDVPGSKIDLKQYFHTSPEISPGLSQDMDSFFMQVTLPLPDVKAAVTITEAVVPPEKPGTVAIIFDLELFPSVEIPSNEDELWKLFQLFREKKDAIFEACITDKTRELIR